MVPAAVVDKTLDDLVPALESGDAVIDGGNSYYRDDIRRAARLAEHDVDYVDTGTSGGVWGLDRGYCLMIGGPDEAVGRLDPIFASLAPGVDSASRTPGRDGEPAPAEQGYLHCGPSGAGHFVKMVHNGIEYGVMAAYAEGLNILRNANAGKAQREVDAETAPLEHPEYYQYDIDLPEVAEVWRRGSVIGSWLLDLTAAGAAGVARALRLRRTGLGLGRGPVDVDRGDRGGRAGAGAQLGPVLAVRLTGPRRLRGQGAVGDAQGVRRPRREGRRSSRWPGSRSPTTAAEAADVAAGRLADAIADGRRARRGPAHLSLAGGSTPRAAYERLAEPGRRLGRSRAVARGRAAGARRRSRSRNYRMLAESLLNRTGAVAHPVPTEGSAEQAAAAYGSQLRERVPAGPDGVPALDFALSASARTATRRRCSRMRRPSTPAARSASPSTTRRSRPRSRQPDARRAAGGPRGRDPCRRRRGRQRPVAAALDGPEPPRPGQPARRRAARADPRPGGRAGSPGGGPGVMARGDRGRRPGLLRGDRRSRLQADLPGASVDDPPRTPGHADHRRGEVRLGPRRPEEAGARQPLRARRRRPARRSRS